MAELAEDLPDGLALLPARDPLISGTSPGLSSSTGTTFTIADSSVIVTGTNVSDMVRTIEEVVARDNAHDDEALVAVILGIMGVEQPDPQLKNQIRVALVLRRDPAFSASDAKRAFHNRLTTIVKAADAAAKASDLRSNLNPAPTPSPHMRADHSSSAGSASASSNVGAVLQPLVGLISNLV